MKKVKIKKLVAFQGIQVKKDLPGTEEITSLLLIEPIKP